MASRRFAIAHYLLLSLSAVFLELRQKPFLMCRILCENEADANMNASVWYSVLDHYNETTPTPEELLSNSTSNPVIIHFTLPIYRQVLWCLVYALMVIVATGGNLIVIWIILAHKRMRTVTNYFLLNLSIADAMVSTFNVTFNFVYMLYAHWPFGELYCKIVQFVAILSICASVFSLMAISIDRYMAIIKPLQPRMGRKLTLLVALGTWLIGVLMGIPYLLYFKTYTLEEENGRIVCYMEWPDGITNESYQEYIFNVVFLVVTYMVPILAMIFTYARIGLELWGSQSIGEVTQRQMDNIKSKRRVVKMMMVVVIMFAVCWLPYHLYFIVTAYYPEINNTDYIQETYLAIYWLAMSNSMYNPIIYCWMNARFRRGFKQCFACFPFIHLTPEGSLNRRDARTSKKKSYSGAMTDFSRIGTIQFRLSTRATLQAANETSFTHIADDGMK